jgi:hypothetical protein
VIAVRVTGEVAIKLSTTTMLGYAIEAGKSQLSQQHRGEVDASDVGRRTRIADPHDSAGQAATAQRRAGR